MHSNLVFNILTYTDDESTYPKPLFGNYEYWNPLLEHFLKERTIEISKFVGAELAKKALTLYDIK